jgi:hypothetical protein
MVSLFQGSNTLIMNLITSFADNVKYNPSTAAAVAAASNSQPGIDYLEGDNMNNDWVGEYQRGCDWEIYSTELSDRFQGYPIARLSAALYEVCGVVLFGLEIDPILCCQSQLNGESNKRQVVLNPAEFIIPHKEQCHVIGFVIAKNKAQSNLQFQYFDVRSTFTVLNIKIVVMHVFVFRGMRKTYWPI